MAFLPGALLLAISLAALADLGWRLAGRFGTTGAEALLAAATFGACIAVATSLGLGLVGQGGFALLIAGVTIALWALAAWRLPRPAGPRVRLSLPAAAGLGLTAAWVAWLGRYPALGIDPLTYHLTESVIWAQRGNPGAVIPVMYDFPTERYPVTNEVLVSWLVAVSDSLAAALVWTPLTGILFALAAVTGLERMGARPLAAGLAAASVLAIPIAATQHLGPHTDLPALAWAATCGALVAARAPVPAVLAGALAVGTKTTVAPLVLVALVLLVARDRRGVVPAALAGVAVGGVWYLRNWADKGSPLWPFAGGDPRPGIYDRLDVSFLSRPGASLAGREDVYLDILGGAPLLLAAGALAWVLRRDRKVVAASVLAIALALLWSLSPFTGRADDPVIDASLTTVRYLFGALAVAAAALALTRRRAATVVLAVCALLSALAALRLAFPSTPGLGVLLAGTAAGALAAPLLRRRPITIALAGVGVFLVLAGPDLPERHARTAALPSSPLIAFMADQPGEEPIAAAPVLPAVLAGADPDRRLSLIGRTEDCESVRSRLDDGWVVIGTAPFAERRVPFTARDCFDDVASAFRNADWSVYAPR